VATDPLDALTVGDVRDFFTRAPDDTRIVGLVGLPTNPRYTELQLELIEGDRPGELRLTWEVVR
jgi:hypothetical protein